MQLYVKYTSIVTSHRYKLKQRIKNAVRSAPVVLQLPAPRPFLHPPKTSGKWVLTNARSLCNKAAEFELFVNTHNPDIVCVVETWLHNNLPDSLVHDNIMWFVAIAIVEEGALPSSFVMCSTILLLIFHQNLVTLRLFALMLSLVTSVFV